MALLTPRYRWPEFQRRKRFSRLHLESPDSNIASYEPIIFTTSRAIRQDDKAEIYFAGYVLSEMQGTPPRQGKVILLNASESSVCLIDGVNKILPTMNILKGWRNSQPEPPAAILNKHCVYCEFRMYADRSPKKMTALVYLVELAQKSYADTKRRPYLQLSSCGISYRPKKQNKRLKSRIATHKYELTSARAADGQYLSARGARRYSSRRYRNIL